MNYERNSKSRYTDPIADLTLPTWNEIPDLDLYIDQVTALINRYLFPLSADGGKSVLTSTMVNNYVKGKIIPAPVKKKYSKETVAMLFVIVTLKTLFNMQEIHVIIDAVIHDHEIGEAYDIYRTTLEKMIHAVFSGETPESTHPADEKIQLIENVCIAIAYQLDVKRRVAKKLESKESVK